MILCPIVWICLGSTTVARRVEIPTRGKAGPVDAIKGPIDAHRVLSKEVAGFTSISFDMSGFAVFLDAI
jgi:hypothetical protein